MKPAQALVAEWYRKADALARQRGDRDIETPAGDLRGNGRKIEGVGVGAAEYHAHCEEDGSFELATEKRRFLHSHRFANSEERAIWELHVDGFTARAIARQRGLAKTRVQRRLARLLAAFERRATPRPGRPRDPNSLRSEGVRLHVRLSAAATLALDHIRTRLKVGQHEAIRLALVAAARGITGTRN